MLYRMKWALVSTLFLAPLAACGGGDDSAVEDAPPPAPEVDPIDPATVGDITGMITIDGMPPEPETIRMNSDPVCLTEATDTSTDYFVVGADGGFGNVFVHVKSGLEGRTFPPVAEDDVVLLDQDGCRYAPHVFGIRVGQTLQVRNSDPTLHNIHATPAENDEFNTGQPIEGMIYDTSFDSPEVMVPFKCDVHGWMNAYAGVVDHPYFHVTGEDGAFALNGLPPGEYVIEAWHEKLGAQEQTVTVPENAAAEANFVFTITE